MWVSALFTALLPLAAARSAHHPRPAGPADDRGAPAPMGVPEVYSYQPVAPYYEASRHPCPRVAPAEIDLDQLLGSWHLSLLLLADRTPEGQPLLDDSMCAGVELVRTNASMLRLDWQLHQLGLPAGLSDLHLQVSAALLGQPGLWALATPLEGEMVATVGHAAPRSHLVLAVCGEPQGPRGPRGPRRPPQSAGQGGDDAEDPEDPEPRAVHVLTALLTRRPPSDLGSMELLRLSAFMTPPAGFGRVDQRLLSWGQC